MTRGRRAKRERTQDWNQIEQYCLWDEQVQLPLDDILLTWKSLIHISGGKQWSIFIGMDYKLP